MSKTRFSQWIVLACIGTLAACTSSEDGTAGNTELNVLIPNNGSQSPAPDGSPQPGAFDIATVEYTINCEGNDDVFLDNFDSFDDEVTLNGNLEVVDGRTDGNQPADPNVPPNFGTFRPDEGAEVWQGFMDLPPGDCTIELRARDGDDEVICTANEGFEIFPDTTSKVNLVLICDISFQAPVGMLDVDATFSFTVGNFCPDLMQLNCLESNPALPVDALGDPTGDPATTECEVRMRDGDGNCGTSCDPQQCFQQGLQGLLCSQPGGPDIVANAGTCPGVDCVYDAPAMPVLTTTITCDNGAELDCDNSGDYGETSCEIIGPQLGSLAINVGIVPNPADFGVSCEGAASGSTITCTAVTTDGDEDCNKEKEVSFACPGDTPCTTFGGNAACQAAAGTVCIASTCNNSSCDGINAGACCDDVNVVAGTDCSAENGGLQAECDGAGVCEPLDCNTVGCDDGNACTLDGACNTGTGICDASTNLTGTNCTITVADDGICDDGDCQLFVCDDDLDCTETPTDNPCTDDTCNTATVAGVCSNTPNAANACTTCTSGTCVCNGTTGACDDAAPVLNDVCARFSPVAVSSPQTCDGSSEAQTCICEKAQFLAADCELVGNSAPIPLQASAQQLGVAFAGSPVTILPQDAVVLPAALVCGFIGAGFQSAEVADSTVDITYTNADLTTTKLHSFVDPTQAPPGTAALLSPHGSVLFDFGVACGDNCAAFCTGGVCNADGITVCDEEPIDNSTTGPSCLGLEVCASTNNDCSTPLSITTACSVENGGGVGTGPGIIAPLFASPGFPTLATIPPGPVPQSLVTLTPTAAGSVDIDTSYAGIRLVLPDVGGLVSGCLGGACADAPAITSVCEPKPRGTEVSPRVMYDALCTKLGFAACGATPCATDADCPFNNAAIGGFIPGQTCDTGLCTDVNTGTCGLGGPGVCFDGATACGFCEDANGLTGSCNLSGDPCAQDIDCPFGVNDLCTAATACGVDGDCTSVPVGAGFATTCASSDDFCNDAIETLSGGAVSACCSPFGDFTATADICKGDGLTDAEDVQNAPPCCDQNLANGSFKDDACETVPNINSCCAAISTDYPEATAAQNPQLWVN